jgi:membrane-bound lytic murein transglycosylase D
MPTELALLPMVERFQPDGPVVGPGFGPVAVHPSTGKSYRLEQNWWVDERRDVIASTNAALDYLQAIYEMHGDWQLALASYNWGEGAAARWPEPRRRPAHRVPAPQHAGRNALLRPQAAGSENIVAQPELFGISLPPIPNRPYFVTVESRVALDLATAARLAETPVDEILALNPGYKRPVLPTNGSSRWRFRPTRSRPSSSICKNTTPPAPVGRPTSCARAKGWKASPIAWEFPPPVCVRSMVCRRGRASAAATP